MRLCIGETCSSEVLADNIERSDSEKRLRRVRSGAKSVHERAWALVGGVLRLPRSGHERRGARVSRRRSLVGGTRGRARTRLRDCSRRWN